MQKFPGSRLPIDWRGRPINWGMGIGAKLYTFRKRIAACLSLYDAGGAAVRQRFFADLWAFDVRLRDSGLIP